ncbi:F-box/FBD/LRR-repeat protein At1g13570 [Linum perenne]
MFIPKLEFDYNSAEVTEHGDGSVSNVNKILLEIYKILLFHNVSIIKFELAIPGLLPCHEIDPIIRYVSKEGVEQLPISFAEDGELSDRVIGSSFFYVVHLNHLNLVSGKFVTPSWFAEFERLKVVHLEFVHLTKDFYERFIPICPLLEDLQAYYCDYSYVHQLVAPSLKVFGYVGYLEKPVFKSTPLLAVLSTEQYGGEDEKGADMVALFASLPALKQLYVNSDFLKDFLLGKVEKLVKVINFVNITYALHTQYVFFDSIHPTQKANKIEGYKIPSRLFSFTKLKKLYLTGCVFTSLHVSFEEFRMLTCLELRSIKFQADGPASSNIC